MKPLKFSLTLYSLKWRSLIFCKIAFNLSYVIFRLHVTTHMVSTLRYLLSYTWQTRVQSFKCLTWSNIIREFFIFPTTCINLIRSTPLLRRSTKNLKTNTLSFDCPRNLLPWTYLKPEWSWVPWYYSSSSFYYEQSTLSPI